jgi:hypothetical protein
VQGHPFALAVVEAKYGSSAAKSTELDAIDSIQKILPESPSWVCLDRQSRRASTQNAESLKRPRFKVEVCLQ